MTVQELIDRLKQCDPKAVVTDHLSAEEIVEVHKDADDDGPYVSLRTD